MRPGIPLVTLVLAASGCANILGLETTRELSLTKLEVDPGTLTPAFDPAMVAYTLTMPDGVTTVDVTADSTDPDAVLTVEGSLLTAELASAVPIDAVDDAIEVVATSPSGVEIRYTLTLSRAPFAIEFAPVRMIFPSGMSNSVAAGDIDSNGTIDLGVTNVTGTADLFKNDGAANFTKSDIPKPGDPIAFGALVDNDATVDVVIGGPVPFVIGNNLSATFGTQQQLPGGPSGAQAFVVGEFTGDGRNDLAVVGDGQLCMQLGTPAGPLQDGPGVGRPCLPSGPTVAAIAAGQFGGGPPLDVAVMERTTNTVHLFVNNSDATFVHRVLMIGSGTMLDGMVAGDFDEDGRTDLAITSLTTDRVELVRDIGLSDARSSIALTRPNTVAAGDFDGDGHTDLVVGADTTFTVLRGDGKGAFSAKMFPLSGPPRRLAVADLNNDGRDDIIETTGINVVFVLLGAPPSPP